MGCFWGNNEQELNEGTALLPVADDSLFARAFNQFKACLQGDDYSYEATQQFSKGLLDETYNQVVTLVSDDLPELKKSLEQQQMFTDFAYRAAKGTRSVVDNILIVSFTVEMAVLAYEIAKHQQEAEHNTEIAIAATGVLFLLSRFSRPLSAMATYLSNQKTIAGLLLKSGIDTLAEERVLLAQFGSVLMLAEQELQSTTLYTI